MSALYTSINFKELDKTIPYWDSGALYELNIWRRRGRLFYFYCGSISKNTYNALSDVDIVIVPNDNEIININKWVSEKREYSQHSRISFAIAKYSYLKSFQSETHYWTKMATGISPDLAKLNILRNELISSLRSEAEYKVGIRLLDDLREFKKNFDHENRSLASITWLISHASPLIRLISSEYYNIPAEKRRLDQLLSQCIQLEQREKAWVIGRLLSTRPETGRRPYEEEGARELAMQIWKRLPLSGD